MNAAAILLALAGFAAAQVTTIEIAAGSPADQALQQISAETDTAKKIADFQGFVQRFAADPQAAAYGDWQLAQIYSSQNNFQLALEYCDKALALQPHNMEIISLAADSAQKRNLNDKVFAYAARGGEAFNGIGQGRPANVSPADWRAQTNDLRASNQANYEFLQALAYNVIAAQQDPKQRMAYIERFNSAFPDSKYSDQVSEYAILTLQSLNDVPTASAYGDAVLAEKPNDVPTLLMMADLYVEAKTPDLAKGIAYAQRAAAAANADASGADAKSKLSGGLAHADIGFAFFKQGKFSAAIPELYHSSRLISAARKTEDNANSASTEGRVLYALGQCYARLAQYDSAKDYLSQAASLPGPAQPLARQLLLDITRARR